MNSKNKTKYMPYSVLVTAPTATESALTKHSPTLDYRPTVSNPLSQDPTDNIVDFTRKNITPDVTNTPTNITAAFKIIVSNITEAPGF